MTRLSCGRMIRLPAYPLPFLPLLPLAGCLCVSVFLCVAGRAYCRDGREVGEEPNHTSERKPGPLYIISYPLVRWRFTVYGLTLILPEHSGKTLLQYVHCQSELHQLNDYLDFSTKKRKV